MPMSKPSSIHEGLDVNQRLLTLWAVRLFRSNGLWTFYNLKLCRFIGKCPLALLVISATFYPTTWSLYQTTRTYYLSKNNIVSALKSALENGLQFGKLVHDLSCAHIKTTLHDTSAVHITPPALIILMLCWL